MQVGIGLPNTLAPQVNRQLVLDWARAAEAAGFTTLGTIDKPNYDAWDPLISLAAAASVTERIRLATAILQLPNRHEVLVAKQVACIDVLSNGRVDLGLAVGGREDDFTVFDANFHDRGRRFEGQLARMREVWENARQSTVDQGVLGPAPAQQPHPPVWLGGTNEKTIRRAIRLGDAFIFAAFGPQGMAQFTPGVRAWAQEAGKPNFPVYGLGYAGLGDNAQQALDQATHELLRYYGQLWAEPDQLIAYGPPQKVAEDLKAYEASGIDQIILFCEIPDVRQVELLARAVEIAQVGR